MHGPMNVKMCMYSVFITHKSS